MNQQAYLLRSRLNMALRVVFSQKKNYSMPFTFRRSNIPKLDLDVDRGSNFKAWLEEWSAYIAVSELGKENADTKYHVLRLAFSREMASVVDNLGLPEDNKKKIDKIIQSLKVHVEGPVNETVERRNFRMRRQHTQESFDDLLVALRDLIKTCNYCAADDCLNRALREQINEGLQDGDTIEELLRQKDLALDKTIQICRAREFAKHQRDQIKGSSLTISAASTHKAKQHAHHGRPNRRQTRETELDTRTCARCGKLLHKNPLQSPATNKFCYKCN